MSNNKNQNDFPLYLFYQGKNYEAYKFTPEKKEEARFLLSEFGLLLP